MTTAMKNNLSVLVPIADKMIKKIPPKEKRNVTKHL